MTAPATVVLELNAGARSECARFTGVPVPDPLHLALVSDGTPASDREAGALFDAMRRAIAGLHASVAEVRSGAAMLVGCPERNDPRCESLLGLVSSGLPTPAGWPALIGSWITRARSWILPILPAGANPASIVPAPHDQVGVLFYSVGARRSVPELLRIAGISEARCFISYKRSESSGLADQLHEALTRLGWDVYVDRFGGTPGRRFPRQIAEELADKGLVLVLESPSVQQSRWTVAEVSLACTQRLGLLAIQMQRGTPFAAIGASDRHVPPAGDWRADGVTLTPAGLTAAVQFVQDRNAFQRLRRRFFLEEWFREAAKQAGFSAPLARLGLFRLSASAGAAQYVASLAARPTAVADVRRTRDGSSGAARAVSIGPFHLHAPHPREDVEWVARRADVLLERETRMRAIARGMFAGTL